ncbi:MAG: ribosome small subunit-dependent GTPase A [Candidatus Paceibacterota bacterium]
MNISDLGYNDFFEKNKNQMGFGDFAVARVVAEFKGAYKVKNEKGEYLAKITGKQMFEAQSRQDYPAVGDWVAITDLGGEQAVINGLLPRMTLIKRRHGDKNKAGEKSDVQIIAANIDVAFVVESVDRDYNLNRFERYFALAQDGGVEPAIILNKIDLISPKDLDERLSEIKERFPGIDVILTSVSSDNGLDDLRKYIAKGKTYCFLGSSGVGKSSLINKLLGGDIIKTGEISFTTDRGKHTTTARQMYFLPVSPEGMEGGGIVIDNPGMREVGMADVSQGIDSFFDEITALAKQCKYADCTHTQEPGCQVVKAIKEGRLDEKKYANYISLKKEAEFYQMSELEKKEKDYQFGKFLQRVKKNLKDSGHKDF